MSGTLKITRHAAVQRLIASLSSLAVELENEDYDPDGDARHYAIRDVKRALDSAGLSHYRDQLHEALNSDDPAGEVMTLRQRIIDITQERED